MGNQDERRCCNCPVLELGCWLSLQAGHWGGGGGAQVQVQAQAQPSAAGHSSLPLHTSLQSPGPAGQAGRRFCTIPILTFSGSQIGPFLAQGRGPCLQQIFCLPPVEIARCQAKHASGCLSTVDDSLVRVYWQHISGIVAQSSQQALDEEGKKLKKPWRSGPAVAGVGSRRGQDAVLESVLVQIGRAHV